MKYRRKEKARYYILSVEEKEIVTKFRDSCIAPAFTDEYGDYILFVEAIHFCWCDVLLKGECITQEHLDELLNNPDVKAVPIIESHLDEESLDYYRTYTKILEIVKKYSM